MLSTVALQYLVIQGIAGALGILSYVIFSRLVSPGDYGQYNIVVVTSSAFSAFFFSWISVSINRIFQDPGKDQESYVSSIISAIVKISLLVLLLQILASMILKSYVSLSVAVWCPIITISSALFDISCALSMARHQVLEYGIKTIVRGTLVLGVGGVAAWYGAGAVGLLIASSLAFLAAVCFGLKTDIAGSSWAKVEAGAVRDLFSYGWPLAVCLGLAWVVDLSDRYLIYWIIGDAAAGQYALAYGFAQQPMWMAMVAASRATLPNAARAYETAGVPAARELLTQALTILIAVTAPVLAVEIFFAPELAGLFLGAQYIPAAVEIMPIVALATFIQGWRSAYLDISIHLAKQTRSLISMWIVTAIVNIFFNLILIPRIGIVGAAYSTLVAHAVAVGYFCFFIRPPAVLGASTSNLVKIVLAIVVVIGGIRMLMPAYDGVGALFHIGLGMAVYVALILGLNIGDMLTVLVQSLRNSRRR
jgi:O-antigen/teichoic acid export membrane protein